MGFSIEIISVYWNGTKLDIRNFSILFDGMLVGFSLMLKDVKGKKQ